jgi:hypothetical protein
MRAQDRPPDHSKRLQPTTEQAREYWQEAKKRFTEGVENERISWLKRPRVHTAIFEEVARHEESVRALQGFRADETVVKFIEKVREQAQELDKLTTDLGLAGERLALFKQLVIAYRQEPTLENYIRLRREFPDVEIQVGRFGDGLEGLEVLFAFEERFRRYGIDPDLIAGTLDADEHSIDALSLCLMECLIARSELPKHGPGHIAKRREAISDTTINYLIAHMLEALDYNDAMVRIPGSLVVLIRQQLCGLNPDLHNEYLLRAARQDAAIAAGQHFHQTKKTLSIRKLANMLRVSRSMASRWLKDKEFLRWFELGKTLAERTGRGPS